MDAAELTDLGRDIDPAEEEEKRLARSKVATAAARGEVPHLHYRDSDLQWAFADHKEDLVRLDVLARERKGGPAAVPTRDTRWREVPNVTEAVLKEWAAKEKAERHALARAEALRRLGLSEEKSSEK